MYLHRLSLLIELKRSGTIAAVGEALHYSPSGVSQQLAILETEVGYKLLERVGRRVRFTRAGDLLCLRAESILHELDSAMADVAALHDSVRGTVRFAAYQSFNLMFLPDLLRGFADWPELTITMKQMEPEVSIPALMDNRLDVVVSERYNGDDEQLPLELQEGLLFEEQLYLATPADMAATEVTEHSQSVWALEPMGARSRRWSTMVCRSHGFEPVVHFENHDMLMNLALVRAGVAISFVPGAVRHIADLDGVRLTPLPDQVRRVSTITKKISLAYPGITATVEALRGLAELVQDRDFLSQAAETA